MNRKQTHILIVCGVLALVVAILLAACDDNGTPTLPKAPLNTMLNQKAGVCHLSNTSGGSSAAPLLAAPVLVPTSALGRDGVASYSSLREMQSSHRILAKISLSPSAREVTW